MAKYVIGVDLGGTNLRVALGNNKTGIISKISEPTDRTRGPNGIVEQITRLLHTLLNDDVDSKKILGISIGSAGPLDLKNGELVNPTNLPWKSVPLVQPLKNIFKVPVYLMNDCTSAVVGEREFGSGRNFDNLVYVTISTGIGGGVYVDGHLLIGKDGNANEVGHMTIDLEDRLTCGCGKKGHWEAYCSGMNIPNYIRLLLKGEHKKTIEKSLLIKLAGGIPQRITSKMLFDAAKNDDELSKKFIQKIGELNAIGFSNIINIYDPALIIVGGTVTIKNPNLVMKPMIKQIKKHSVNRLPKIKITSLRDDAVLLGTLAPVELT